MMSALDDLGRLVRCVPDFPRAGRTLHDIGPLLADPLAFRVTVDRLVWMFALDEIDVVVAPESRGFLFAPAVAYALNAGLVPARRSGALAGPVLAQTFELDEDTAVLEIQRDAISPGDRVLVLDDVIATGSTAEAVIELVERREAVVVALGFVVELADLEPRARLADYRVESLVRIGVVT